MHTPKNVAMLAGFSYASTSAMLRPLPRAMPTIASMIISPKDAWRITVVTSWSVRVFCTWPNANGPSNSPNTTTRRRYRSELLKRSEHCHCVTSGAGRGHRISRSDLGTAVGHHRQAL